MTRDAIQLIIWAVFGLFLTWGIFLAYIGFRSVKKDSPHRKVARTMAVFALVVGVTWIMFWVTGVAWNLWEILAG